MRTCRTNSKMLRIFVSIVLLLMPLVSLAKEKTAESTDSYMSNAVFLVLAAIIVMLALVIFALAEMVKAGGSVRARREKEKKKALDGVDKTIGLFIVFFFGSLGLQAQDAAAVVAEAPVEIPFDYWGLGAPLFFSMLLVIVFELVIVAVLYVTAILLLRSDEKKKKDVLETVMESRFMRSITDGHSPEEEEAIMMDHEYDGIRELDNNLPGWWKYGFYLTIIVAVIYLFHYHVLGTGLSSPQEYEREMLEAEAKVAEYKKNSANSVDETTVTLLTDANSISAGKMVYSLNCVACHGDAGQGLVGPNLTDDYWMHKGSVVDVFKSIKYGWPDKGMKSWEQDLNPLEMQQVTSFILSLRGSNPANAKEKEGEFYSDSTAISVDAVDSVGKDTTIVVDTLKK